MKILTLEDYLLAKLSLSKPLHTKRDIVTCLNFAQTQPSEIETGLKWANV